MNSEIDEILNGPTGDQFYAAALREFTESRQDAALYARAIADSNGSDGSLKARYIRLRTQRLAADYIAKLPPKVSPVTKPVALPRNPIYEQLSHAEKSALWQEFNRQWPEDTLGLNNNQRWREFLINRGYTLPK